MRELCIILFVLILFMILLILINLYYNISKSANSDTNNISELNEPDEDESELNEPNEDESELNEPDEDESDFNFKKICRNKGGTINLYKSGAPEVPFSGALLSCEKRGEYGTPEVILASEIEVILEKIKKGEYSPKNEKERLQLYLSLVYPKTDKWKYMSEKELYNYYMDLEFYYKLPKDIMPETLIKIHRNKDNSFYRVPDGVILDQDTERTGVTTPYIEVTRFGPSSALMRDPRLFNGTYYYPSKGSGLFLPVGNTLIAYNKVHAMKMLDVPNSDIVRVGGRDFQSFLKKDSDALWKDIKAKNPKVDRKDYWVKVCAVNKHAKYQDKKCEPYFGSYTNEIWYIEEALDKIINEMTQGNSLRMDTRKQKDGQEKKVKVYYGLGDSGDKFLANIAKNRSYDSLQFLRESQMSMDGDAIVGSEYLHLMEPSYSQSSLMRLDPFDRPYYDRTNNLKPHINYLLDKDIKSVKVTMLSESVYDPREEEQTSINTVVPERN